jgi:PLP dependent protein
LGKTRGVDGVALCSQRFGQQFNLGTFAASVDALDRDELSGHCGRQSNWSRGEAANSRVLGFHLTMAQNSIRENLLRVQERIAFAAQRAGRRAEEITLIGVSKTHPAVAIHEAYEAGLRHFGENRVQEWEGKRAAVEDLQATFHLIGHLQSNKAARAAKLFHSIDSVDDFPLAQKLQSARSDGKAAADLRVLIEVHIGGEEAKSGVAISDSPALAEKIAPLPGLDLKGLMCIPPFSEDIEQARPYFARLRKLRDELAKRLGRALPVLSMGMSHDFEIAVAEGATEVRVGTAIFGARGAANPRA